VTCSHAPCMHAGPCQRQASSPFVVVSIGESRIASLPSFVAIATTRNFVSTACSACGPNGNAIAIYAAMTAEEVATLSALLLTWALTFLRWTCTEECLCTQEGPTSCTPWSSGCAERSFAGVRSSSIERVSLHFSSVTQLDSIFVIMRGVLRRARAPRPLCVAMIKVHQTTSRTLQFPVAECFTGSVKLIYY